jgi:hypothetical protein
VRVVVTTGTGSSTSPTPGASAPIGGAALDINRRTRNIFCANGVVDAYSVIRYQFRLETATYERTEDVHRRIIGKDITGHDAFN